MGTKKRLTVRLATLCCLSLLVLNSRASAVERTSTRRHGSLFLGNPQLRVMAGLRRLLKDESCLSGEEGCTVSNSLSAYWRSLFGQGTAASDAAFADSSKASFYRSSSLGFDSVAAQSQLVCEPGCLHGGTCKLDPKTKSPVCLCPLPDPTTGAYFRGRSCQTEAVRCNATWWCENGGACRKLDSSLGDDHFGCTCPSKFQGLKCQTPVTPCGGGAGDLWCANGGECVFSEEANTTICKCPSTHAGSSCETLVEPQDLGPPHTFRSNFTSPVVLPPNGTVELLEEEQQHYFKTFFLILGVLLSVWATALAVVHCPRPRSALRQRAAAALRPLKGGKEPVHSEVLQRVLVLERLPRGTSPLPALTEKDAEAGGGDGGSSSDHQPLAVVEDDSEERQTSAGICADASDSGGRTGFEVEMQLSDLQGTPSENAKTLWTSSRHKSHTASPTAAELEEQGASLLSSSSPEATQQLGPSRRSQML